LGPQAYPEQDTTDEAEHGSILLKVALKRKAKQTKKTKQTATTPALC